MKLGLIKLTSKLPVDVSDLVREAVSDLLAKYSPDRRAA